MLKLVLAGSVAATAFGLALGMSSPALAFGYQVVKEDNVTGFVGAIPTSAPAIIVGSDGESPFDPFGAGFDTSDGIQLNANWAPDPAFAAAFAPGFWTQLPGTFTWVLPACVNSVCENGNVEEPVAKWDFLPGGGWAPGTLGLRIVEDGGGLSDLVTVANDGASGAATITFNSGAVPEPAEWVMMLVGFGAIGYAARRRSRVASAA